MIFTDEFNKLNGGPESLSMSHVWHIAVVMDIWFHPQSPGTSFLQVVIFAGVNRFF